MAQAAQAMAAGGEEVDKMRVCLDPGHGGRDPGAVRIPLVEQKLNLLLMQTISRALFKARHQVQITRLDDRTIINKQRAVIANEFNADIFVSIHHNAFPSPTANGFEVLYHYRSETGRKLAKLLCEKVSLRLPIMRNRGPKPRRRLVVLRDTKMPAILIEAGFISSDKDRKMLTSIVKRRKFYNAIAKSLVEVLDEDYI